jgi:hypothetical protein
MQYMLSVHSVEGAPTPSDEEMQIAFAQTDRVNAELQAAGAWVFGGGLHPPNSATVVRVDGGATTMTDGPFAETKEQLGGYYLVEAKDLNDAIQVAGRIPAARTGGVEVRPIMTFD